MISRFAVAMFLSVAIASISQVLLKISAKKTIINMGERIFKSVCGRWLWFAFPFYAPDSVCV